MLAALWQPIVEKGLSFAVKSAQTGETIGVTVNFDFWDKPRIVVNSKLTIVHDFHAYLEEPIRDYILPKSKDQIIYSLMMSTSSELNAAENVLVMRQMEEYCLELTRREKYASIFTINTNPLTQQLSMDVYGFEPILVYQVNKYERPDDSKPFGKAPDSQLVICSLKMIN
ncbi:PREDICTED: uncharacterized protein LOC106749194 [Dinoponera quadriceps]|uniref:Uncharacterized protein LOC106749194 n=1 Tax=Dinoponera quadriceps TaxID=609295 RepID=A0A6P3Y0N6_DINQU|nr:PREDICTED: uncharacterized protein LOC106749194 [Dinoponera quadriceps]